MSLVPAPESLAEAASAVASPLSPNPPEPAESTAALSSSGPSEDKATSESKADKKTRASSEKRIYPAATPVPTIEGSKGIRFDFNEGCRVVVPEAEHPWRIRLRDIDTGNVLFDTELKSGRVHSTKRYFVRFRLQIFQKEELVFSHDYSAQEREVLIQFPVGTLGDTMGWFPYAAKFQEKHKCRLTCAMSAKIIPLFRDAYPDIHFVAPEEVTPERYYATYTMGLFFDDKNFAFQPCDFRYVGLHRTAGYILGVDPTEERPRMAGSDDGRPIAEPYVCIATQSTTQCKYWNNPDGWRAIIRFLKEAGYRVVCIDQKATHGNGIVWNHIPHGVEDETGDRPLAERVRWLRHAEFFVGLSSGLSWLAWAVGIPVVMISGFSHPLNEFETPHRVINFHTCNSCWNDPAHRFDHVDFLWCPRHKGTSRQFECTRLITVSHVKAAIQGVPNFGSARKVSESEIALTTS